MKTSERHHLKDNELADITAAAGDIVQERGKSILLGVVAIVVVAAGIGGFTAWRNSTESKAHAQLAGALAVEEARVGPPAAFGSAPTGMSFVSEREKSQAALTKFKEVADAYPTSDAGLYARYRQGTTYMALGAPKSAAEVFQQVLSQGGNGIYAQMAKLGLAEAQAQNGEFEAAITVFRDLAQRKDGELPVDGLLMRLGRTQLEAGKAADAEQTFNKLVAEHPDSSFAADAKKELGQMKKAS